MNKPSKVWDLPTRLFHWGLLAALLYSWLSVEILEDMQQHFYAGYCVLTLLLFRLVWGVIGSRYSRFRSFIFSPSQIICYVGQLSVNEHEYHGHNPLGGLAVMAMLLVLIVQVTAGLFSNDDYFYGPLSGLVSSQVSAWFTRLHSNNIYVIYALMALHVFAIAYYQFAKNQSLTKAMITGNKDLAKEEGGVQRQTSNLVALIVLLVCAALVYCLINVFSASIPTPDYGY